MIYNNKLGILIFRIHLGHISLRQTMLQLKHGLWYAPKTSEYRTSNIHLLLEITGCFIETWTGIKNKTQRQKAFGSHLVAGAKLPRIRAADRFGCAD